VDEIFSGFAPRELVYFANFSLRFFSDVFRPPKYLKMRVIIVLKTSENDSVETLGKWTNSPRAKPENYSSSQNSSNR
jgi:hypothetical protein